MKKHMICWAAGAAISVTALAAAGGECTSGLYPLAGPSGIGLDDSFFTWVRSSIVFDDGSGEAMYFGGGFETAGGEPAMNIARWNGESWEAVGEALDNTVAALAVFDDGSGEALYAGGGYFGQPYGAIAKWNGSEWEPFGQDQFVTSAGALEVYDDGSGPALFVAGTFAGDTYNGIGKWDGNEWTPLGEGLTGQIAGFGVYVWDMEVFDDGSGPALYVGGNFMNAGGQPSPGIAKWDGTSWSSLETGLFNSDYYEVYSLKVFDDGSGPALFAGGLFDNAGQLGTPNIAKWDGQQWLPVGGGADGYVNPMQVFDRGDGPALYMAGVFEAVGGISSPGIARWTVNGWEAVQHGISGSFLELARWDTAEGSSLFIGGTFEGDGSVLLNNIAELVDCVPNECPSDVNGSGETDLSDLNLVLANFGSATTSGDADGNGQVDLADLNIVLGAFGSQCS